MGLPRFKEEKATQLVSYLLAKDGGRMHQVRLIKLLYLVDREAFRKWGFSVTNDDYWSMTDGPVLSHIYQLVNPKDNPPSDYWDQYINERSGMDVCLKVSAPTGALTKAEKKLIDAVYEGFGHLSKDELVKYAHENFEEWSDPRPNRRSPIILDDLLRALGKADSEVKIIREELEAWAEAEPMFV